jgi:hypothetical protein
LKEKVPAGSARPLGVSSCSLIFILPAARPDETGQPTSGERGHFPMVIKKIEQQQRPVHSTMPPEET